MSPWHLWAFGTWIPPSHVSFTYDFLHLPFKFFFCTNQPVTEVSSLPFIQYMTSNNKRQFLGGCIRECWCLGMYVEELANEPNYYLICLSIYSLCIATKIFQWNNSTHNNSSHPHLTHFDSQKVLKMLYFGYRNIPEKFVWLLYSLPWRQSPNVLLTFVMLEHLENLMKSFAEYFHLVKWMFS